MREFFFSIMMMRRYIHMNRKLISNEREKHTDNKLHICDNHLFGAWEIFHFSLSYK